MRVDLNATVRTRDGKKVGTIHRAIVDADSTDVTGFVLDTGGLLGRQVILARDELERATHEGEDIHLRLSESDVEALPTFVPTDYGVPPVSWTAPADFGMPPSAYLWTTYPPPSDEAQPDAEGITKGATVRDRRGDTIGVVDEVRFDPKDGKIDALEIRVGGALRTTFGGGDVTTIPGKDVSDIDAGVVKLRLDKEEVEQLAGHSKH